MAHGHPMECWNVVLNESTRPADNRAIPPITRRERVRSMRGPKRVNSLSV
ncbi:MAG: hypothetical protein RRC34_13625 [Lentisphaeria bacterium]|nr:hypothetical protein [Lentisphaeria bacterium]